MELEFDKEIDAILRRPRPDRGVLVGDDPPPPPPEKHVDADAIAAFAENALPQKAKLLYMEHFADCDGCRKMLANAVAMSADDARAAPAVVSAPLVETAIPWYTGFLGTRNLAFGMGALVLIFSGVLGYLVLQDRDSGSATVSQAIEPETRSVPAFSGLAAANANTAPAPAATQSNSTVAEDQISTGSEANVSSPAAPGVVSKTEADGARLAAVADDKDASAPKEIAPAKARPEAPAPSPPAVTGQTVTVTSDAEKKAGLARSDEITALEKAKREYGEDRARSARDLPAAASKAGPSRSGPLQNQSNQVQNKNFEMPVTRSVGGKTFNNRDGAWYDSSYRGQATLNYRRGTDEYKKLDSGLRAIADNVGGTVVVLWKGKAYRIS